MHLALIHAGDRRLRLTEHYSQHGDCHDRQQDIHACPQSGLGLKGSLDSVEPQRQREYYDGVRRMQPHLYAPRPNKPG